MGWGGKSTGAGEQKPALYGKCLGGGKGASAKQA
ncbi:MAG: hypothetical protein GDYSWBUE_002171 [Candidatus Fervidibacterota bacterium]